VLGTQLQGVLQPRHGLDQSLGLNRFEHIVHGLRLKGLDGILVVGRHKHQQRTWRIAWPFFGQLGGGFKPALAGHADVKKQHVRAMLQGQVHGTQAVASGGHYLQLGPQGVQFALQGLCQQWLVFGDQGGGGCGHGVLMSMGPFPKAKSAPRWCRPWFRA
jgi:hypothetical protein